MLHFWRSNVVSPPVPTPPAPNISRVPLPPLQDSHGIPFPRIETPLPEKQARSLFPWIGATSPSPGIPKANHDFSTPHTNSSDSSSSRYSTPHDTSLSNRKQFVPSRMSSTVSSQPVALCQPQPRRLITHSLMSEPSPSAPLSAPSRISERSQPPGLESAKAKKPLKGILKNGSSRQAEQASVPRPQPPPRPKQQEITLHWLLLPYDPTKSKKLIYFNIEFESCRIFDHTDQPTLLNWRDMVQPASATFLTEMTILCPALPYWRIHPENSKGLTVKDVFEAIYNTFHVPLTEEEIERYIPDSEYRAQCEKAFRKRCRRSIISTRWERDYGMCRVDLLKGRNTFMGLRLPPPSPLESHWVLEVGYPKSTYK